MPRKKTTPLTTFALIGAGIVVGWLAVRQARLAAAKGEFAGKVVLITGGSRGIGQALAEAFAAQGASLVLAARSAEQLEHVAATCRVLHPQVETLCVPTDVGDPTQLENLIDQTIARFGRIDILVNNAGISQGGRFEEDEELGRFQRQMEINLMAAVRLTQLALPHMLARNTGWIVNISSIMGRFGFPFVLGYVTSKHALNGFSEGLRRELYHTDVRVLSVIAGFVETDMIAGDTSRLVRSSPLSLVTPEQVARQTLNAVALGQAQIFTGWFESLMSGLNVWVPRLMDHVFFKLAPPEMVGTASSHYTE
ncbi:MAG: SDR family oxidoreductase [Chloroflexi bacterium]|nr:SDR family oxidoreductase [Chloroflexota bacterium]